MESAAPAGPPSLGLGGPEKLVGKDDAELLPRDLAVRVAADDRAILRSGEPLIDSELSVTGRSSSAIVVYRVAHPVDQHRRSSLQVLGQQQAGPPPVTPICATRVPKASRAKTTSAPNDAPVEAKVALDAPAWHVEEVELPERLVVQGLSAPPDLRRPAR